MTRDIRAGEGAELERLKVARVAHVRINQPHPLAGKYVFISDDMRRALCGQPLLPEDRA